MSKEKIFTPEFLEEINFSLIKEEKGKYKPYPLYGSAKDKIGMTILEWCDEGASCTYFGEPLEPNTSFGIKKDGGTRYAFNGYVFTQEDVRNLLNLTW